VSLTLEGEESVTLYRSKKPTKLSDVVINKRFEIYDYAEFHNCVSPGDYSFPFEI